MNPRERKLFLIKTRKDASAANEALAQTVSDVAMLNDLSSGSVEADFIYHLRREVKLKLICLGLILQDLA